MSTQLLWSAVLTVTALVGLALVGRGNWWGWAFGLADEALWVVYAVLTRQWPFIASALAYGFVCGWNLRRWIVRSRAGPARVPGPRRASTPG
jgi:hypothetical protein